MFYRRFLPHLKIGNIIFKNGLALAPMAGVTDSVFRRICKSFGAEYMVSEMISAKAIVYRDSKTPELAKMRSEERPMALSDFRKRFFCYGGSGVMALQ